MMDGGRPEHYDELPHETREFLENLRPEEVALLNRTIRLMVSFGAVGKIVAYVVAALVGFIVGIPMLVEAVEKTVSWLLNRN